MTDETPRIWQESKVNGEGISVSTYIEHDEEDADPKVVDETYWTWAELLDLLHQNAEVKTPVEPDDG